MQKANVDVLNWKEVRSNDRFGFKDMIFYFMSIGICIIDNHFSGSS